MSLSDFVQKIIDFFFSLFSASTEDFKNQKALRSLAAEVRKAKYPIFRPETTVLAGLPIIVYELNCALLPLRLILKSTIASSDIRVSGFFADKLVESSGKPVRKNRKLYRCRL